MMQGACGWKLGFSIVKHLNHVCMYVCLTDLNPNLPGKVPFPARKCVKHLNRVWISVCLIDLNPNLPGKVPFPAGKCVKHLNHVCMYVCLFDRFEPKSAWKSVFSSQKMCKTP